MFKETVQNNPVCHSLSESVFFCDLRVWSHCIFEFVLMEAKYSGDKSPGALMKQRRVFHSCNVTDIENHYLSSQHPYFVRHDLQPEIMRENFIGK